MVIEKTKIQRRINLNKDWRFCWGGDSSHLEEAINDAYKINYDDSNWRRLNLPHDWSIEFDFNIENSLVGSEAGYLDGGIGWYRKTLVLPREFSDKRLALYFGGVYMDSTVYINEKQIGKYPNGYMPFTYDITDYVVADGLTENVITVKAVNEQPSSRWYSGSGIYRDVELIVTDSVHVVEYGTFVTTPNIESEYSTGKVNVNIRTEIKNESNENKEVKVCSTLLNYDDNSQASESKETESLMMLAGQAYNVEQEMCVENLKLWSNTSPNLYKLYTEVIVDNKVVDTYETRCGFRWFKFDANEGFSLNDQWMKLKGVCMHHDQGALGSVANKRAIERQMEIMQDMGANAIRVTHNPAADDLLRICDEKGLLVIDEAFDTWYYGKKQYDLGRFFSQSSNSHPEGASTVTWAEFDLKKMIKRGRNFPSIIAWSVGNEVGEAHGDERSLKTIKNMKKWAMEVDPTRGITQGADKFRFGTGEGGHEDIAEVQDTVGFNYAEANYDSMHAKHPHWAIYGSETSSATKSRGVYSHPDSIGSHDSGVHADFQQSSYDNDHVGWGKTATNSWIEDRDRKYVAGQFIWTGFDYIGEPTPWHNTGGPGHSKSPKSSYFGIVDTAGFPKDDYYLYQSVWKSVDESPMVHILPHWNWEDDTLRNNVTGEDGKIPLRVYSNAPHIELFINGESQGTKSFSQKVTNYGFKYQQQSEDSNRLYLEWRLDYNYNPGTEIKAVAKNDNGEIIAVDSIVTAGQPAKVALVADKVDIKANGDDLCYITVSVTDEYGNFMPTSDNEINFDIEGNGIIVGVDNGNPISHERYKNQADGTWKRKVFNGKAIIIVQSTEEHGEFTLKASSTGLIGNSITVNTVSQDKEDTVELACNDINYSNEVISNEDICNVEAYETVMATTDVNVYPCLPNKIKARLNTGLIAMVEVQWDNIPLEKYSTHNEFYIEGTVKGQEVRPKALITVKGVIATEGISVATVKGIPAKLPEKVTVYYSDGMNESRNVKWNDSDVDYNNVGITTIKGIVEELSIDVAAKVRITENGSQMKSSINYAKQWTGSEFPAALASFTNNNSDSKDSILHVNDTIISFDSEKHNRWTNYQNIPREKDWVGILFAEGGNITKRYIDTVRVGFFEDDTVGIPKDFTVEYYVKDSEPTVPSNFGHVADNDLGNDENWRSVDNLILDSDSLKVDAMNKLSFNTINTYAIRINMIKKDNKHGVAITELEAYGKNAIAYEDFEVNNIIVNGNSIIDNFDETLSYTIGLDKFEPLNIEVKVSNNARVTVIPAIDINGVTKIEVIPENGDVAKMKCYKINSILC